MDNQGIEINVHVDDNNDVVIQIDTKTFTFTKEYIGSLYAKHPIRRIYNAWKRQNIHEILKDIKCDE
jgi:hypothetical protein